MQTFIVELDDRFGVWRDRWIDVYKDRQLDKWLDKYKDRCSTVKDRYDSHEIVANKDEIKQIQREGQIHRQADN